MNIELTGTPHASGAAEDVIRKSLGHPKLLELSRQQRNLLLMRPVFELEARKLTYEAPASKRRLFESIDASYLVLSLLDDLMEAVAVGSGRTTNEVIHHIAEIACTMQPEMHEEDCYRIGEVVLDAVANRSDKHKSFEYDYFDATTKSTQTHRFKLVDYAPDISDSYRFVPTREGYLVYLGMLDLAPEDAAELMEKMLHLLIDRGRFSEAIDIAKKARTISIEFSQKIRDTILRARRAPSTVNWKNEIQPRLHDARSHVHNRQREDSRMNDAVQSSLSAAYEYSVRQNLGALRKLLQDSVKLRTRLLQDIMSAPEQFMEAQRALFKIKTATNLPDLENLLLPEVMRLSLSTLAEIAEPVASAFMTASLKRIFDLNSATQLLLEKRESGSDPEPDDGEILPIDDLQNIFSKEQLDNAMVWLLDKLSHVSATSSEILLNSAAADGLSEPVCHCIALLLYQYFGTEDATRAFNISATQDRFRLQFVSGTILTLQRRKEPTYEHQG